MKASQQRPHDLGGSAAGSIATEEHEITFWEQRIDAMVSLMRAKGVLSDWAELRAGIEALSPEDYESLGYYERWAISAAEIAIRNKLLTREQLEQRIEQLMQASR